jgi:hypothetical protein
MDESWDRELGGGGGLEWEGEGGQWR